MLKKRDKGGVLYSQEFLNLWYSSYYENWMGSLPHKYMEGYDELDKLVELLLLLGVRPR